MSEKAKYAFETLQVHAGQEQPDPATDSRAVPIYLTSSYVFKDAATAAGRFGLTEPGNIYSRLTNPTVSIFEERVAALEGGVGSLGVATGSAAITIAVQNIATAGDHIVSSTNLYGGTLNLFEHTLADQGLSTTFVNPADLDAVEAAIQDNTKLLYAETLGNPNSTCLTLRLGPTSRIATTCRLSLTPHSPRPTCCAPSSTAPTSSCIPPRSSSAATARPWAA